MVFWEGTIVFWTYAKVNEFQKYPEIRYFGHLPLYKTMAHIFQTTTVLPSDTMVSNMLLPQYFFNVNHIQIPWYLLYMVP